MGAGQGRGAGWAALACWGQVGGGHSCPLLAARLTWRGPGGGGRSQGPLCWGPGPGRGLEGQQWGGKRGGAAGASPHARLGQGAGGLQGPLLTGRCCVTHRGCRKPGLDLCEAMRGAVGLGVPLRCRPLNARASALLVRQLPPHHRQA